MSNIFKFNNENNKNVSFILIILHLPFRECLVLRDEKVSWLKITTQKLTGSMP